MPLSIEVSGFASTNTGGAVTSVTVSGISTASSNAVIYAWVEGSPSGAVTISGGGLTWNTRIPFFSQLANVFGQSFYAIASSPLSAVNITVGFGRSLFGALAVVSVAGANSVTPFDGNATVPLTINGTAANTQSGVMSTTSANDLLLGMIGYNDSGIGTAASGWTQLSFSQNTATSIATEYLIVSSAQTSAAVSFISGGNGTQGWVLAGDAIVAGAAVQNTGTLTGYLSFLNNPGLIPQ